MNNPIKQSPWTTAVGIAGGLAIYLSQQGPTPPSTSQGWTQFAIGLTMAVLGVLAKDGL